MSFLVALLLTCSSMKILSPEGFKEFSLIFHHNLSEMAFQIDQNQRCHSRFEMKTMTSMKSPNREYPKMIN